MEVEKKEVICVTCKKKVTVVLKAYGGGHIAICPVCGELAYNGD